MSIENGDMSSCTGTPQGARGGSHKTDEGGITGLLSSVKCKISQTLSPDSTGKTKRVGDNTTKITSPEYKKPREGKKGQQKKKVGKTKEKGPPPPTTAGEVNPEGQTERDVSIASTSTYTDVSQEYDTDDDLPLSDLSQKVNKDQSRWAITRTARGICEGKPPRMRRLCLKRKGDLNRGPLDLKTSALPLVWA